MNTRYASALLGLLSCLLIGRSVQGHDAQESGAAEAATPGVQLVQAGTPSSQCPSPTHQPQGKVTAGKYCVCDVGTHTSHNQHKGPHLELGDEVVIGEMDWVTKVDIGKTRAEMNRSADHQELSALIRYEHTNTLLGRVEKVTHAVRITPADPGVNTRCDETKNVLKLTYCFKQSNGKWACQPEDLLGGHLGDTHVEN